MSKAFLTLGGAAPQVLLIFLSRRRMARIKSTSKRRPGWVIENNGSITLSYREVARKYDITKNRFTRAIDQLIEHGFIAVQEYGGGLFGKPSYYTIIDDWRLFGTNDFEGKCRDRRNYQYGFCRNSSKPTCENDRGTACENDRG